MTASPINEVTEADFDQDVLDSDGPVLVEFYATWCGNCRRLAPVLDRLAAELSDRAGFVKVNAETAPELVDRYQVRATPTLIRIEGGEPVASLVGAHDEQAVRDLVVEPTGTSRPARRDLAWVPADACRLPSDDLPLRLAAFNDFFATAVQASDRLEPTRLRLELDPSPASAARAAELAAAEADCCAFFTFTLTSTAEALTMDVAVPEEFTTVLDGMAEQARTAGAAA